MAENKTQLTRASVNDFLDGIENEVRREDARMLVAMMKRVTGVKPQMWGPSIIGFGIQHYKYESGREGDMPRIGFSPRKGNLALYMLTGPGREALARLGKHKTGVSCLYINKLSDVDMKVLEEMAADTWKRSNEHPD
jgi:hypothetical protein